jgi:hypothetical protein
MKRNGWKLPREIRLAILSYLGTDPNAYICLGKSKVHNNHETDLFSFELITYKLKPGVVR